MNTSSPVFIVGCPRSGTTILAELLSDILDSSIVESHFIPKYYAIAKKYLEKDDQESFKQIFKAILRERPVRQWKIKLDLEKAYEAVRPLSYSRLVDYLSLRRAEQHGRRNWGDKTPHYLLHLDTLYYLFPKARFVKIIRDGRDVALSLLNKKWGPNNVYACAKLWAQYNTCHRSFIERLKKDGYLLEVYYESLLRSPDETIRELSSFLEVSIDNDSLKRLTAGIKVRNYDKWKRELGVREQKIFEAVAGDTLRFFGYELVHDKTRVSSFEKMYFTLHDRINWLAWFLYDNSVNALRIRYGGMQPFWD